MIGVA